MGVDLTEWSAAPRAPRTDESSLREMTMPSNNPAFRGLSGAGNRQQSAGWGAQPQPGYGAPGQYDPYSAPSPYAARTTQYLTMDDVVTKTGISFLVTVLAAAVVWALPGQAA